MGRRRTFRPGFAVDLPATLGAFAFGGGDVSTLVRGGTAARAARTAHGEGAVMLTVRPGPAEVEAEAWGPGAEALLESVPALLGAGDDPSLFRPVHPVLRDLHLRRPGMRFGRTGAAFEAVVPTIVGQKVAGREAKSSYRRLARAVGRPAPGPVSLVVPPDPAALAALPYEAYHPFGIERRRAEVIRAVARSASRLEEAVAMGPADAFRRITAFPGIGPWTAAYVMQLAMGDPDAVPVGDYNLPSLVSWNLAGEARGDDARMLELLAPYAGQRARVLRLLEGSGVKAPRFGPRVALRRIENL
jgi:3-methyladenine DNA glycosylase/8-oxoguanine DNA glycosylase